MSGYINWNPENDKYSKSKEFEIHHKLHEKKYSDQRDIKKILGGKRRFRTKALRRALKFIGNDLQGNVLEIGAGDGWCSAYISKNMKKVNELYTMECDIPAVEKLIPQTFDIIEAPKEKLKLVLGSFNNIQKKDFFDFVIAMGAIHHSANLFKTFEEIYSSLKKGGYVIAQEPYMKDDTVNEYYFNREDKVKDFWGVEKLENKERTDLFYRMCEYRTAAYHVGFDFEYLDLTEEQGLRARLPDFSRLFKRVIKQRSFTPFAKTFKKVFKYKSRHSNIKKPENMVMILQKPDKFTDRVPPTSWEKNTL